MKQRLSDAIEDYYAFRKVAQRLNTVRNEQSSLLALLTCTGNIYVENLTDGHVSDYLAQRSKSRQPSSLANDLSAVRGFCNWARRTKRAPRSFDPTAGIKSPKRERKERARLHVAKFPALLDAAESRCPRDRAFIALCLYTLGRTSEIESLRVRDVDLPAGSIHMRIHKTRKEHHFPIVKELDRELRRWLTIYSQEVGELDPNYYLVPARKLLTPPGVKPEGRPVVLRPDAKITQAGMFIVKPALAAVGFSNGTADLRGEGAHTLRRSAARAFYDRNKELGYDHAMRLVQTALHHSSITTTEIYIGLTADRQELDSVLLGQEMYGLPEVPRIGVLADGSTASAAAGL